VVELGKITSTSTPAIDAVYALASLLAKTLQEAKGRLQIAGSLAANPSALQDRHPLPLDGGGLGRG
jgi:hypothetical protein